MTHILGYKGHIIRLEQDEYTDSPEEWGDKHVWLGTVGSDRHWQRYTFGRTKGKGLYSKEEGDWCLAWGEGSLVDPNWSSGQSPWSKRQPLTGIPPEEWADSEDYAEREYYALYEEWLNHAEERESHEVFPVRIRDYGGGHVQIHQCNPDQADGYIFVYVGQSAMEKLAIAAQRQRSAEDLAESLLATWNQYLEGDVWVLTVFEQLTLDRPEDVDLDDPDQAVEIDGPCGGFYGYENAVAEGKSIVDFHIKNRKEAV